MSSISIFLSHYCKNQSPIIFINFLISNIPLSLLKSSDTLDVSVLSLLLTGHNRFNLNSRFCLLISNTLYSYLFFFLRTASVSLQGLSLLITISSSTFQLSLNNKKKLIKKYPLFMKELLSGIVNLFA
jgi:hypothetical protein